LTAAEVIKSLAQAAGEINRATALANEKIQRASDEAILTIKKASKTVSIMINDAIDAANEKIFRTAETEIAKAVGEEEAEFFDLAPLKDRWAKRK